ncbi:MULTISPECIES: nitrogenase component 1 [Methanosarcina]|uniref:Nitrogenase FeMo-cofactor scaffold and assembly protein NifN n=2 Tax=Methanosarcina barkeri TaxID=2208 RepID=A0A0E3QVZ9_METBA|nr:MULTISPECIES: nitrogenase component 1 [Methanosarcina]AKB55790.1 Nitrogenase FeMo-cofactor scaffold and assembly protein NifN [Methanosarcina barkeri MS]AKB59265.1 Nitrogenase FeMo-cofactor scaffold and assembly protein NifN [Methanosarcina barkeri 227]OED06475.1 nitrogenase associated protein N [Methanosarcina sp. A14]
MTKRNYATVNPCVMCQPMGSALAFKGIENTMVLYHGSQGCSTYMRLLLAHHFREPVDIASSSLSEKGAVYGGRENLKKGLRNVINRYNPKVIGVATTCLAETIGDDVPAIIREFKEEQEIGDDPEKDIIIIPVSTPSYGESHVSGYIKALDAVVRKFTEKTEEEKTVKIPNGKLNVIPVESLSPADVRELKEIFDVMAGDYIFLPDISETFDAPLREDLPKIAPGGTPLSEIADMPNSRASLGLGTVSKNLAVKYLEESYGVHGYDVPIPIGLSNTDIFFTELVKIIGCPIPEKYQKERGRLLDAMVDVHKYLYGVKAAVYGDPDFVFSLTTFMLELGINPVLIATGSKSRDFETKIRQIVEKTNPELEPVVLNGIDFDTFNDAVSQCNPEILIGNSNGRYIAKSRNIPLVRVGLPIHDRVGAQRILNIGYRGAMELLDRITNTILEATDTFTAPRQAEPAAYTEKRSEEECVEGLR